MKRKESLRVNFLYCLNLFNLKPAQNKAKMTTELTGSFCGGIVGEAHKDEERNGQTVFCFVCLKKSGITGPYMPWGGGGVGTGGRVLHWNFPENRF